MKKNWKSNRVGHSLYVVIGLFLWLLVGCETSSETTESTRSTEHKHVTEEAYTCPMHPQIVQDKSGSCPICGMDLVKKAAVGSGDSLSVDADLRALLKPTNSVVVTNMSTVRPERQSQPVAIQANGIVTYDTRRLYTVPARFGGRIEKLYVRYSYQPVRKGQKLLELYSPEIVTAQRELLYLLEADAGNAPLIAAAKQKLRLMGITDGQISELITTRTPSYSVAVFSPYNGYVIEETAQAPAAAAPNRGGMASGDPAAGGMGGGMSSGTDEITFAPPTPAPGGMVPGGGQSLLLREGQYVQPGQTLFRLVNTSQLWAEFRLYARDAADVKPGDALTISFDQTGQVSRLARVSLVVPFIENGGQFVTIRAYLPGDKNQRVGQLARAVIRRGATEGLWLPTTAVLDLGNERVVFVRQNGAFRPVRVQTGPLSGKLIAIVDGLKDDQDVARNAQFLVDSESFVNVSNSNE